MTVEARMYAVITQSIRSTPSNSPTMVGSAVLSTVWLSAASSMDSISAANNNWTPRLDSAESFGGTDGVVDDIIRCSAEPLVVGQRCARAPAGSHRRDGRWLAGERRTEGRWMPPRPADRRLRAPPAWSGSAAPGATQRPAPLRRGSRPVTPDSGGTAVPESGAGE